MKSVVLVAFAKTVNVATLPSVTESSIGVPVTLTSTAVVTLLLFPG